MPAPIVLALTGDLMLGREAGPEIVRHAPEWCWGDALPLLRGADAVFGNLECALSTHPQRWKRTPKACHFVGPPEATAALRAAGVSFVGLANNHILDAEEQGLRDTLGYLEAADIPYAGAGEDLAAAERPAMLDIGGLPVAVVAATDTEKPFAATASHPGTHYLMIDPPEPAVARVAAAAAAARAAGARLVVLALHWGETMVEKPPPAHRRFAQECLARGVDIVYGHSARLNQAVARYGNGLILYDTGAFLDDYEADPWLRNDWSFLYFVELEPGGALRRLRLVPVRLHRARAELAQGAESESILARMERLCKPFQTPLRRTAEGLELDLRAARPGRRAVTG